MPLVTRLWGNKATPNLFTTVPGRVRDQLLLTEEDRIVWRLEGGYAAIRKLGPTEVAHGIAGNVLYRQSRSRSLYAAIPVAVMDQLRLTPRSRAEWELHGDVAHMRRA